MYKVFLGIGEIGGRKAEKGLDGAYHKRHFGRITRGLNTLQVTLRSTIGHKLAALPFLGVQGASLPTFSKAKGSQSVV